ncbi:MAG: hypothetical protein DCC67_18305 [Planctomycetota bacterium]|nr:MAG: hypothetical protein DCC67_18305 [Planctomycetota bacterium]
MPQEASNPQRFQWHDPADAGGPAPPTPDEAALGAAVKAALESGDAGERVLVEEMEALREVASRHGASRQVSEAIAVDLVAAILTVNYRGLKRPPDFWKSMAAKIAAVLLESPSAQARLENLWRRLIELHGPDA